MPAPPQPVQPEITSLPPKPSIADDSIPSLVAGAAELHLWNLDASYFEKQADVIARIVEGPGPYEYWLVASGAEGQVLAHRIDSQLNQRWSSKVLSFTWNHIGETGRQSSWCFRFEEQSDYEAFLLAFTKTLWESLNQYSWDKAKV